VRASAGRRGVDSKLDSEAFKAIESGVRGCTTCPPSRRWDGRDRHVVHPKGIQCFGFGPAIDMEDGPRGFGAHSDQERILESELHRFVRLKFDIVSSHARAGGPQFRERILQKKTFQRASVPRRKFGSRARGLTACPAHEIKT
jgi:hypothetical protein